MSRPLYLASSVTNKLAPAGIERDATALRQPAVPAFPQGEIVARQQIVGVLLGLVGDVDDGERHHQLLYRELVRRRAALGEMDRRVHVGAGVLAHAPPIQIVAVLPDGEFALHLDARLAVEGRKFRRHGVGEIHHRGEALAAPRSPRRSPRPSPRSPRWQQPPSRSHAASPPRARRARIRLSTCHPPVFRRGPAGRGGRPDCGASGGVLASHVITVTVHLISHLG